MNELAIVLEKLSNVHIGVISVRDDNVSWSISAGKKSPSTYIPGEAVGFFFSRAASLLIQLKNLSPALYGNFPHIAEEPTLPMLNPTDGSEASWHYSITQLDQLIRDISQILEIKANSELAHPNQNFENRVFISHGKSNDWRSVQAFIEKDIQIKTIELPLQGLQEIGGLNFIEVLIEDSNLCNSAVIVMTGDDIANEMEAQVRENLMHEIGFFQGSYGRNFVFLLHEDGVNIPTNLAGVACVPYPKGSIEAGFHVLQRKLKAIYKL